MRFLKTPLAGLFVIEPDPFRDSRGIFVRIFCEEEYKSISGSMGIAQINQSLTHSRGALRGLHYQRPPKAEKKVVRCLKGRVFDVAVDLRAGSATFLHWYSIELSAKEMNGLYIPEGFAHGFQTLEENCELLYLHSAFYSPAHEGAVRYDDPLVGIKWPLPPQEISMKDREHPYLSNDFQGVHL